MWCHLPLSGTITVKSECAPSKEQLVFQAGPVSAQALFLLPCLAGWVVFRSGQPEKNAIKNGLLALHRVQSITTPHYSLLSRVMTITRAYWRCW